MTRLYVVVEGQTEEAFVKGVLRPYLASRSIWAEPIIVSTSRATGGRKAKGGGNWKHWYDDLKRVLQQQRSSGAWVTTMFDLYGLPSDFPNIETVRSGSTVADKIGAAERAIRESVTGLDGAARLIPYVQQHEYEALVLASLEQLELVLDADDDLRGVASLKSELAGHAPEDVNDGPNTAPSKRLQRHIPGYDKVLHGELAVTDTPLSDLAERCPHFGAWVARLMGLGDPERQT